jgi:polysaccharide biosynthesis/export protein
MRLTVCTLVLLCFLFGGALPAQVVAPLVTPVTQATKATTEEAKPAGVQDAGISANYVIGPDDSLQVTVWKEPSLSGTFPVRPDGMISLVLLGDLMAAGRTPMQLGEDISLRLKKYIQEPNVTVLVAAVNSHRIFLVGEVQKVGPLPLSAGMTPLQAIAAAGGLTAFANSKHIYILRGAQGKQIKIPFNYKSALKGDIQGITLQSGDTIVVP